VGPVTGGGVILQIDFVGWLNGLPSWIYGVISWLFNLVWAVFNWLWNIIVWFWALAIDQIWWLFKAIVFPGLVFILFSIIFSVWFTRKVWGRVQARRGPFHLGKYGGLQVFADAIKLIGKEIVIPDKAKRWMYRILPSLLLVAVLIPFAFIPWSNEWYIADLSVSLILTFAFLTVVPVVSLLSGWISGSKYTLIGGFRAANNQFAAEIPLIISSVGPAMLAGSLSIMGISQAQSSLWFFLLLPVNCVTFMVSATVITALVPFDAPVADSEILFGWRTEFSGIYFTMTYFAEFAKQLLFSGLIVALFFGGSYGFAFMPPVLNFIFKFLVVLFFMILVTSSFYRMRQDQVTHFCWKYLLPLSLLNVVIAMFAIVYVPGLAQLLGIGG
jgi:NADH-quinone oxidoreductase subunit H